MLVLGVEVLTLSNCVSTLGKILKLSSTNDSVEKFFLSLFRLLPLFGVLRVPSASTNLGWAFSNMAVGFNVVDSTDGSGVGVTCVWT